MKMSPVADGLPEELRDAIQERAMLSAGRNFRSAGGSRLRRFDADDDLEVLHGVGMRTSRRGGGGGGCGGELAADSEQNMPKPSNVSKSNGHSNGMRAAYFSEDRNATRVATWRLQHGGGTQSDKCGVRQQEKLPAGPVRVDPSLIRYGEVRRPWQRYTATADTGYSQRYRQSAPLSPSQRCVSPLNIVAFSALSSAAAADSGDGEDRPADGYRPKSTATGLEKSWVSDAAAAAVVDRTLLDRHRDDEINLAGYTSTSSSSLFLGGWYRSDSWPDFRTKHRQQLPSSRTGGAGGGRRSRTRNGLTIFDGARRLKSPSDEACSQHGTAVTGASVVGSSTLALSCLKAPIGRRATPAERRRTLNNGVEPRRPPREETSVGQTPAVA